MDEQLLPEGSRAFLRDVVTEAEAAREVYARHGLRSSDAFCGLHLMGGRLAIPGLLHSLGAARDRGLCALAQLVGRLRVSMTWKAWLNRQC